MRHKSATPHPPRPRSCIYIHLGRKNFEKMETLVMTLTPEDFIDETDLEEPIEFKIQTVIDEIRQLNTEIEIDITNDNIDHNLVITAMNCIRDGFQLLNQAFDQKPDEPTSH